MERCVFFKGHEGPHSWDRIPKVPDKGPPPEGLCWIEAPILKLIMGRCTHPKGHQGPHTWEGSQTILLPIIFPVLLCLVVLTSTSTYAQVLPMGLRPLAPGVFASSEDQHKAAVWSRVALFSTVALDTWTAVHCPARTRCLVIVGARTGATIGLSELVKHLVPKPRPCAPLACGSDPPFADWPSEDTAWATQAIGAFDHGAQCGSARAGPRMTLLVSGAALTATLRRAAWRHDIPALLLGAGLGAGVDVLVARIAC